MPTLIDAACEKLAQSLRTLLENASHSNSDLPPAELISRIGHELREGLNLVGQHVIKAVIESHDCPDVAIERNGRSYSLKDEASEKIYFTEFGQVRVARRYYHCHLGDSGIVPLDELLEMDGHYATPDVVERILWLSAELVPGTIAETFDKLLAIKISPKAIQNIVNQDGARIAEMIETQAEQGEISAREIVVPEETKILVASMDGANLRLREKGAKRVGATHRANSKNQDLSIATCFKNAMVGSFTFYETVDNVLDINDGSKSECPFNRLDTFYTARMPEENYIGFKQEFMATLNSIHQALGNDVEKIVLMDGARSCWHFVEEHPDIFEGYHFLLDFYHTCEHLAKAAEAIFGKDSAKGKQWRTKWISKLKHESEAAAALIRSMTYYADRSKRRQKALQEQLTFFRNNQHLMNYHTHVMNGWPIGSGPVEAGCKTIIKSRFCRSGMRWSREGGRSILILRVLVKSGDWNYTWNHYRHRRRQMAA